MRMQLSRALSLFTLLGLAAKGQVAQAQSYVKLNELLYDEGRPGITVKETEVEAVVEFENQDKFNLLYVHDSMTGASPNGVVSSTTTVTGASAGAAGSGQLARGQNLTTFKDTRNAYNVGYTLQAGRLLALTGTYVYSKETDYLSQGGQLGFKLELNQKNTTLNGTARQTNDTISPTLPHAVEQKKRTAEYALSATQLLAPWALVNFGYTYGTNQGYLTEPYKKIMVGTAQYHEARPDSRLTQSVSAGIKVKPLDFAAVDLQYRYYWDDWKISSNTTQLRLLGEISESWLTAVTFRNYEQTGAYFWANSLPDAAGPPKYRSADVRLSPYKSQTLALSATYKLSESWSFDGMVAKYAQWVPQGEEEGGSVGLFNDNKAMLHAIVASLAAKYTF